MRSAFPFSFWKPTIPVPTVTSITPNIGFATGGTSVHIVGAGFLVSPPTVLINGVAAGSVVVTDDNNLTAVTGASTDNPLSSVNVTTTNGTSIPNTLYDYFDPMDMSVTCLVYLNARNGITISPAGRVSAAADQSGHGNNAVVGGGVHPPFNTSDVNFNNFPSISSPSGVNVSPLIFAEPTLSGTQKSYCMIGMGSAVNPLNCWFSNDTSKGAIFIRPALSTSVTFEGNGTTSGVSWTTTEGNGSPAVTVYQCNNSPTLSKVWVNAQTGITGDTGVSVNNPGDPANVGGRLDGADTQNMAGQWTDFLLFDGPLSDADAIRLQTAFGAIYGITINP